MDTSERSRESGGEANRAGAEPARGLGAARRPLEIGEVGLLLLLAGVGLIPVIGKLVSGGWSQTEVGLGLVLAGFAGVQLARGLIGWWWSPADHDSDHASRSRNL